MRELINAMLYLMYKRNVITKEDYEELVSTTHTPDMYLVETIRRIADRVEGE
jgi:membrane peptidoglycan carboxypeptidase